MTDAQPLRRILAAGLKAARERRGLRQEDAAARARAYGLSTWIRGTIAQAEVGARRLSLEEIVLLALAYETTPAELIGGDDADLVELTPDARVKVGALKALLSGNPEALAHEGVDVPARHGAPPRRSGRFPDVLGQAGRFGMGDRSLLDRVALEVGDAERHAARKLGVTPQQVNEAAVRRWGRSLAGERDRRLSEQAADVDPRRAQAIRGHITRELMTELQVELGHAQETEQEST